ncbi:OLC1v1014254C1 [Oldenlandia corymbosa var. corymbosa]|uniref:OLC1v1014254C1 n=1 Tax=Oldenlandia corymbosa var. corymbosa TaxID=529605 RepID=A0AAV1E090_OLDCO|nr:OLC1v1014254C1 [Oldenlandia corymbosa var. corymbosa]
MGRVVQTEPFHLLNIFIIANILLSTVFHHPIVHAIRHQNKHSKNPVFSLPLHPHDHQKKINYTSLAISSLARDKARVEYINSRIRKALLHNYTDPSNFFTGEEEIETSLSSLGGGYLAKLGFGQPVSEFDLLADTGSEVTWLQCYPCKDCDPNSGLVFDPSQSSTYQPLSCSSQQCDALQGEKICSTDGNCNFIVRYGDRSASTGDFATETLSFGSSGSVGNVGIGCGRETGGLIAAFSGILGLGPSPVSFPSQIKATSFSYCLVEPGSGSSSTLDFNSAAPGDSVNVKLVRNPKKDLYYYVELTGITVGEDQVPVPPSVYQINGDGTGGVIVDSGTTLTFLDPDVYNSFQDAFQRNAQNLADSQVNFQGYDTCYEFASGTSASDIQGPAMSLQFSGGQTVALGPGNYFKRVADSTFCLAFEPTNQIVSIIGNVVQSGMRVTYDLGNNLIGFSPNMC